ncbi:MAG: GntR family transcriptional regulator [Burkholderiaceae bacterium]
MRKSVGPRVSSSRRVYESLRELILSLELKPGSVLDEGHLTKALGGSRTPLREAVIRLSGEGLIELLPNRGARVSTMELPQLQEHLEAFELMQRTATVLAAQRRSSDALVELRFLCEQFESCCADNDVPGMIDANWAFHHAIGAACGNRFIAKMYDTVLSDGLRVARLAMAYECYGSGEAYMRHIGNIIREHREIVDALEARDVERASALSDSHSNLARTRVSDYLAQSLTRDIRSPGGWAPLQSHV